MGAHDYGDHTVFTKEDNELPEESKINWGYNCLTAGIHHGRPEPLWNLPLFQASMMFGTDGLKQLVVARIFTDAMQFVEDPESSVSPEWATKTRDLAEENFDDLLDRKMTELQDYYESSSWHNEIKNVIEGYKDNKLNAHYTPLHSHDSINLLCRILGTSCSRMASLPGE